MNKNKWFKAVAILFIGTLTAYQMHAMPGAADLQVAMLFLGIIGIATIYSIKDDAA